MDCESSNSLSRGDYIIAADDINCGGRSAFNREQSVGSFTDAITARPRLIGDHHIVADAEQAHLSRGKIQRPLPITVDSNIVGWRNVIPRRGKEGVFELNGDGGTSITTARDGNAIFILRDGKIVIASDGINRGRKHQIIDCGDYGLCGADGVTRACGEGERDGLISLDFVISYRINHHRGSGRTRRKGDLLGSWKFGNACVIGAEAGSAPYDVVDR